MFFQAKYLLGSQPGSFNSTWYAPLLPIFDDMAIGMLAVWW